MNFDDEDKLKLQHLAGGNIVKHAPVFSANGRFIFVRCGYNVQVFVTSTGELTRELRDATEPLIGLQLDIKDPDLLMGCTSKGKVLRWHWRTGVLQKAVSLKLKDSFSKVFTFNLLDLYKEGDTACAFVTVRSRKVSNNVDWFVYNTSTGERVDINCNFQLKDLRPYVDASKGTFKFLIISQGVYVHFVNYENWTHWRYKQAHKSNVTCVRVSPCEQSAASADQKGRIIIWRRIENKNTVLTTEHHWHSTPVSSLAFSPSGLSFYSSGAEAVLVKWSLTDLSDREFLPRMSSAIRHIVVSDGNEHVLVCTEENAMQFIAPQKMKVTATLQHFTYALPDKTGTDLFPIGLCLNPRTNSMVLNGRVGNLQFFSSYTKSLLYNLRIVQENVVTGERNKILHKTRVTRAAFNIDWMATGEVYNDHQNFPELRLKFWQYHEKMQTYKLNTIIELPHEVDFQAIAFSNQFKVDNLRCASGGKDNVIKLWTLSDSENIYRRGSMWICCAQASYKQETLGSICFSQDGSLLAAGFGRTLVLYDARSLGLLHALSTAAGFDGVVSKAQLRIAQTPVNGTRTEVSQQRQQLWSLLQTLLDSNDTKLIEQARQLMTSAPNNRTNGPRQAHKDPSKEAVFKHIMQMSELGLHQKLQLLRRFGIECSVHDAYQNRLDEHLKRFLVDYNAGNQRVMTLKMRLRRLHRSQRFKAKLRVRSLGKRRSTYEQMVAHELLPLFSVLNLDKVTKPAREGKRWASKIAQPDASLAPVQSFAQISHVQFGAGAQAHLVTVCTETRVLIWNLMTLRLQAGLKLSVEHLAFDPHTNLIAAVTRNNELHVFQPNVPLPVYQRCKLPKLNGLVWLPRRQPKNSSINVDWQAQSTLHMLTDNRKIVYLAVPGQSTVDDAPAPISFAQPPVEDQRVQYATFGTFMANQRTENKEVPQRSGPLIVGRGAHNAVNALVNLSAHTMPAMSLICGEFIKSLLTPAETSLRHNESNSGLTNGKANGIANGILLPGEEDDEEEEEDDEGEQQEETEQDGTSRGEHAASTLEVRKALLEQNTALEQRSQTGDEQRSLDERLQRVAKLQVQLNF